MQFNQHNRRCSFLSWKRRKLTTLLVRKSKLWSEATNTFGKEESVIGERDVVDQINETKRSANEQMEDESLPSGGDMCLMEEVPKNS